jgi:tetratricopeptide (TPR) repeat protein
MSFDKTKVMRGAERLLAQGKIRAAIVDYKTIVNEDPKDYSTLNLLGDLYAKAGDSAEAIACFTQVADHYGKQGFAQKAIAIFNKISRLDPDSLEVSRRLAHLYKARGSVAEARTHFNAVAARLTADGKSDEALEVWKELASLDPQNSDIYLKIGDAASHDGLTDEAVAAFSEAGRRLASKNQPEAAAAAFARALEIRFNDIAGLGGLVGCLVKLGSTDEAVSRLESVLEAEPFNREVLYLLVDCYIDSRKPAEAERAVIRLVEKEPANYPKFLDVVEVYVKNEDLQSAARILTMSSEHLLSGGQAEDLLRWIEEILARNPEHIEGLRLLIRYCGWQRDESGLKSALERLVSAARESGSVDDERFALAQLAQIAPHDKATSSRLKQLNSLAGIVSVESPFDRDEFPRAVPVFENLDSYHELEEGTVMLASEELVHHYAGSETDGPEDMYLEESEAPFEASAAYEPTGFAAEGEDAGSSENFTRVKTPGDRARLASELESIEFYIEQGYQDLAEKSLSALESEFGPEDEITAMRSRLPGGLAQQEANEAESNGAEPTENLYDIRNELGMEDSEPGATGDFETCYQMGTAYMEMGLLEDAIREFQDAFSLVKTGFDSPRFFSCCNLLGHCFMEKGMPNISVMWYRRALDAADLHVNEQHGIRYELGNAYEKAGDHDKARELFEEIYANDVEYRDVSERVRVLQPA